MNDTCQGLGLPARLVDVRCSSRRFDGAEEMGPLRSLTRTLRACLLCIVICAKPELRPPPVAPLQGGYFGAEKMFVIVEKSYRPHHQKKQQKKPSLFVSGKISPA